MEPLSSRWLILGSAAAIVLTQIACTAWIGQHIGDYHPADNSAQLDKVTERLAGLSSAVGEVQNTADNIQARTSALVNSMGSVARACTMR